MKIMECMYKNLKGILIENDSLSVVLLPELGGKIASIKLKERNFELLAQNPKPEYALAQFGVDFSEYDASGFDDCFPSISQGEGFYNGKLICYPDHGEIWSTQMQTSVFGNTVKFEMRSQMLPYYFSKTLELKDKYLCLQYEICNFGLEPIDCFYTVHCLVHCDEQMILEFPKEAQSIINVLQSKRLGVEGSVHTFPIIKDAQGTPIDLRRVQSATVLNYEKFYVNDVIIDGKCGIYYPKEGVQFTMYFDPEKLPYLGFWVTEGGFRGDYNCAFEPSNGYYDSIEISKQNNRYLQLMPNETFRFKLDLELKVKDT